MERGLFPITPQYKVQGPPGSTAELAVQFTGGVRSYFDGEVANVYDEGGGGQAVGSAQDALPLRHRGGVEEAQLVELVCRRAAMGFASSAPSHVRSERGSDGETSEVRGRVTARPPRPITEPHETH